MKLNSLLTIPSIRSTLDEWLKNSWFGGKQKFQSLEALNSFEREIVNLHLKYKISIIDSFEIVTNSAEALAKEIYNI
jgi:hypothetical protein